MMASRFTTLLPTYEPALLGTMPSIYQLLPRPRHGAYIDSVTNQPLGDELYDVEFWKRMEWGLADPAPNQTLIFLLPEASSSE